MKRADPESACALMRRALALAQRSAGHTRPNPPVGAVVAARGVPLGEGRHCRCGGDHAEVAALKDARCRARAAGRADDPCAGATVYCTLEPCSKPGRVGACCDALVAARVKRVEWAVPDPNPRNRARAARILGVAGIETACWASMRLAPDDPRAALVREARRLIAPFAKHVATGLPFVTVKLALSLDGRICDDAGDARWVSSARARRATGRLRASVDCVLVGAETVRRDDPSLLCHAGRNDDLFRAVVSRSGRLPPDAQIFTDAARARTLVYRDAAEALADLGKRGFLHVLCEGGLELARSLAAAGQVDEWITVLAPKVIGHAPIGVAFRPARNALLPDGSFEEMKP